MFHMIRIDPHAHTMRSDGTDTPAELVAAAKRAGLDYVGITDHDTTAGWQEAAAAAVELGVGLIRGVEVSSALDGQSVHVLGLLTDEPAMQGMFTDSTQTRAARLKQMTENLGADFPLVSFEEILEAAAGAPLGRPHLADELVAKGYFPNRNAAFEVVLHESGPYYVPQDVPHPVEVVRSIRAAGGVPILAHPLSRTRGKTVGEDLIADMVDAGLFGIERNHRDHTEEARLQVDRIAKRLGLALSAGSDYHGRGKPNKLGENLLDPYILSQIEEMGKLEVIHR